MQLSVQITTGQGAVYRWGGDESDPGMVPESISFGSSIPGGYRDATIGLSRPITGDFPDLNLYDDVRIYLPGNETVWEGRVAQLPRSVDSQNTITVGCVGWAAHLRDNANFCEVYVDQDLTKWVEPPADRRLYILTTLAKEYGHSFNVSAKANSIRFDGKMNAQIDSGSETELWYTMPTGLTAATVYYRGKEQNVTSIEAAAVYSTDTTDGATVTANAQTLDDTIRTVAIGTPTRYLILRSRATANVTKTSGTGQFSRTYKVVAVYGSHGLTLQDPSDTSEPFGLYASDIISDVVSRSAPLLSTRNGELIDATSFVIPQASFTEPTTAEDVIQRVNAYDLYEWGVYDNREFFYRAPNPERLTWKARLSDGASLQLEGEAGDEVYNGVVVTYTNAAGETKTVGPTGGNFDDTSDDLLDSSETNPVNSHGIPARYYNLEVTRKTTKRGAIRIGGQWLTDQSEPQRRGEITLTGQVEHPTKGLRPVATVKAGDFIRVSDHSNDVVRRIIDVSYDHGGGGRVTCQLDNSSSRVEAVLERFNA